MNRNAPIGVFDSGLGGLTVVHSIKQSLPNESIIYFGDTARVPYGAKSAKTVTHFSRQIINFLIDRGVKMVVVACNTASALALTTLKKQNSIPIIGVIEPGAEAAVKLTRNNHIGVIGTTATIQSDAYSTALKNIKSNLVISTAACPLFVPLVEEGWTDEPVSLIIAEIYLKPLSDNGVDTVILGCTHYPIIKTIIQSTLHSSVKLVDSAEAVSDKTAKILLLKDALSKPGNSDLTCYVTDLPQKFEELGERFLGEKLANVALAQLD